MKKGLFFALMALVIIAILAVSGGASAKKIVYPVIADYSKSLIEMIQDGNYDFKNSKINDKHFPIKGSGTVEVVFQLVHFRHAVSSDQALTELDSRNLRPATLPELLAFGAKFPEFQRQFPIIALGSVWVNSFGERRMAYLSEFDGGRGLCFYWPNFDWFGSCRFLAVSK